MRLVLGGRHYDVASRALVMGILNRTTDSFFDRGAYFALDDLLRLAERHVEEGADVLDVGGVKAGPGPEVTTAEEMDRVVPAVAALVERFDLPVSVDTWRASVAEQAFAAGAVIGNDISGFGDPDYLGVVARAGASVIATHIRLRPRVPDPDPAYPGGLVETVLEYLSDRARRAEGVGILPERIMLDAGLDLGKTPQQSLELLRSSRRLSLLGYSMVLSASNKPFLGALLDLPVDERGNASSAATALGVLGGCRVVRAHDVKSTRRTCDVVAAVIEAA